MSKIKSPLRYPGAKSRAISQIDPLIPEFKEYREPFIGGGSVYLSAIQKYGEDKKYWINDLYYPLYNFLKQTQQNVDIMIENILIWKGQSNNGHQLQQMLRINSHKFNDIQKGAAYYVLNRVAFSGLPRGCSEHGYNTLTEDRIKSLRDISDLLHGTQITNLDYSKLVDADGDNVFLYCDPPYFNIKWPELYGKSGIDNLHTKFDHQRFAETIKKCKHKFLITYDDSNTVRKLFDWANITEFSLQYTMRRAKIAKELFISNYKFPENKQKLIDDAWDLK